MEKNTSPKRKKRRSKKGKKWGSPVGIRTKVCMKKKKQMKKSAAKSQRSPMLNLDANISVGERMEKGKKRGKGTGSSMVISRERGVEGEEITQNANLLSGIQPVRRWDRP